MKAAQGELGRIFVLRLEDGDLLPQCVEEFARDNNVEAGVCALVGGIGSGKMVVGPEDGDAEPITPMLHAITGVAEAAAVGTLFPNERGEPVLHMHAALGREGATATGCIRPGVEVWKIAELVLIEIKGTGMARRLDPNLNAVVLSAE